MTELGSKQHISVVATDYIGKKQILRLLKTRMPCARQEDFLPFTELVCAGKEEVMIGELVLNCFVNTVIPFTPQDEGPCSMK